LAEPLPSEKKIPPGIKPYPIPPFYISVKSREQFFKQQKVNTMKKLMLSTVLALIAFSATHAQQTDSVKLTKRNEMRKDWKNENGGNKMGNLQEKQRDILSELDLTPNQGQEIKKLNQSYMQKAKALREDGTLSAEEKKEKLKAMNKERDAEMKNILGNDKYKLWQEKRKEMAEKARENKMNGGSGEKGNGRKPGKRANSSSV
jgi:Spy/CpxP family protein refolding chaperone